MSELKFRAFRPNPKPIMYYFTLDDLIFNTFNKQPLLDYSGVREGIERFTSRKIGDKDIYEGDLIYITIFDCFGGDKQYTCRVEWWGSAFWLVSVKNEEDRWELDWALSQDDEPEIRGNIHEHADPIPLTPERHEMETPE